MSYKLITLFLTTFIFINSTVYSNNNLSAEKKNQSQLALAQARHDKKLEAQVKRDQRHQAMAQLYANSGQKSSPNSANTTSEK